MQSPFTRSPNAREHAGLAPRLANPGAWSCVPSRGSCARFSLLLVVALGLMVGPAWAANVRIYFRSNTNETVLLTNDVISTPISGNILANGIPVAQGIPTRIRFKPDGLATNYFAPGFYALTNSLLGSSGIVIRIDDSGSQLYDITNVLWSGYNKFVGIVGSNLPPTYDAITNALSFLPASITQLNSSSNYVFTNLTGSIVSTSNSLQAQITSATNSGITAVTATNIAAGQAAAATNKLDTDLRALVTASTNGLSDRLLATNTALRALITTATNSYNFTATNIARAISATNNTTGSAATATWSTNLALGGTMGGLTLRAADVDNSVAFQSEANTTNLTIFWGDNAGIATPTIQANLNQATNLSYSPGLSAAARTSITNAGSGAALIATNKLDTDLRTLVTATTNGLNTRLLNTNTALRALIVDSTNKLDTDLRTLVTASTNGLSARLLATNTALRDLITATTNGLSDRLLATNTALRALVVAATNNFNGQNIADGTVRTNEIDTTFYTFITSQAAIGGAATNAIPLLNGAGTNTTIYRLTIVSNLNLGTAYITNATIISGDVSSNITITSGKANSPFSSIAGALNLKGGAGANSPASTEGGTVNLTGGAGGFGGAVAIAGGAGNPGFGGPVTIVGGASQSADPIPAGSVTISGGANTSSGVAGSVTIQAGASSSGTSGGISLQAGDGSGGSGTAGSVVILSGSAAGGNAGDITIATGSKGDPITSAGTIYIGTNYSATVASSNFIAGPTLFSNAVNLSTALNLRGNPVLFFTTNNLAVTNAGSAAANGTYKFAGGAYFTNTANSSVVTNNGSTWQIKSSTTVLYSSSTLENPAWTIQSGSSPAAKSYYGSFLNLDGQVWLGNISSTNLDARLAGAATSPTIVTAVMATNNAGTATTLAGNPTNIIYVELNGSDSNNGKLGSPKATISSAVAAATNANGALVKVGVGTFSARVNMPHNVSLQGAGRGLTVLDVGTNMLGFVITNGNHFTDFTITSSPVSGQHGFPFICYDAFTSVTNCSLTRVVVNSKTDTISLLAKTNWFKATEVDFYSGWDSVIIYGLDTDENDVPQGYVEFNECRFFSAYNPASNPTGAQVVGLQSYERTVLNNCVFNVSDSPTATYGLMTGIAGNITLNSCVFNVTSTNGTVWSIFNENAYGNTSVRINSGNLKTINVSDLAGVAFDMTGAALSKNISDLRTVTETDAVTNFQSSILNGFTCNLVTGYLTNTYAGTFDLSAITSISVGDAGLDNYSTAILSNGVQMANSFAQVTGQDTGYAIQLYSVCRTYLPAGTALRIYLSCDSTSQPNTQVAKSVFRATEVK